MPGVQLQTWIGNFLSIEDLHADKRFPQYPDSHEVLSEFAYASDNGSSSFNTGVGGAGGRGRGWRLATDFVAPLSGEYRFFVSSTVPAVVYVGTVQQAGPVANVTVPGLRIRDYQTSFNYNVGDNKTASKSASAAEAAAAAQSYSAVRVSAVQGQTLHLEVHVAIPPSSLQAACPSVSVAAALPNGAVVDPVPALVPTAPEDIAAMGSLLRVSVAGNASRRVRIVRVRLNGRGILPVLGLRVWSRSPALGGTDGYVGQQQLLRQDLASLVHALRWNHSNQSAAAHSAVPLWSSGLDMSNCSRAPSPSLNIAALAVGVGAPDDTVTDVVTSCLFVNRYAPQIVLASVLLANDTDAENTASTCSPLVQSALRKAGTAVPKASLADVRQGVESVLSGSKAPVCQLLSHLVANAIAGVDGRAAVSECSELPPLPAGWESNHSLTRSAAASAVALVPTLQACLQDAGSRSDVALEVIAALSDIAAIPEVEELVKLSANHSSAVLEALICPQLNLTELNNQSAGTKPKAYPWAETPASSAAQTGWTYNGHTQVRNSLLAVFCNTILCISRARWFGHCSCCDDNA